LCLFATTRSVRYDYCLQICETGVSSKRSTVDLYKCFVVL